MAKELGATKVTKIFAGPEIVFLVNDDNHKIDLEVVADALKKHEIKFEGEIKRNDEYVL